MSYELITDEELEKEKVAFHHTLARLRTRLNSAEQECIENRYLRSALLVLAESYLTQIDALDRACQRAHRAGMRSRPGSGADGPSG
jgi:hypothetical protein